MRKTAGRLPLRSLRLRLSLAFTLLVAGLLVIADGGLIGYAYYAATLRTSRALERSLVLVRAALENEVGEVGNPPSGPSEDFGGARVSPATEALRELEPALAQEGVSVLITDEAENTWRGGVQIGSAPLVEPPAAPARDAPDTGWRVRSLRLVPSDRERLHRGNNRHRHGHFPRDLPASDANGGGDRWFVITTGVWWPATERALQAQVFLLSFLTLFMVLVAGVGAFFLIGRTLRPIDRLAQQAREQAAGVAQTTSERLVLTPPSPDAEVVNLVGTLNQLLRTVGETAAMKSRFYSAASHELRGPLQVLAGRAELALSLPRSRDDYRAALVEVQEQADHLVALVQSLLLMNRLERESGQIGALEFFALAPLCHRQVAALVPQIHARQLNVVLDTSLETLPELRAVAASHGEILVRNLLDNAVRYTPSGGTLQSAARVASDRSAVWEVVNTSAPLPDADVARLTEPFYRPDPSRSAQTGGSGLGLAICQTLCDLNGWSLSLVHQAGEFHASVVFPLASAQKEGG